MSYKNIVILIVSLLLLSCVSDELSGDQGEARVIEIIDYSVRSRPATAIFLDNNKVLHIPNTGSGLTVSDQIRSLFTIGDIVKYEYGDHVTPQWEAHTEILYEKFQISSNLIIDSRHLLEINGISILSFFTDDPFVFEHWVRFFPYLRNYDLCECRVE